MACHHCCQGDKGMAGKVAVLIIHGMGSQKYNAYWTGNFMTKPVADLLAKLGNNNQ